MPSPITFPGSPRTRAAGTPSSQPGLGSADLFLFADFLASVGIPTDELMEAPDEWAAVTWGLVKAFVEWMLQEGYAVGSVNVRLSTIRTYARLAWVPKRSHRLSTT